MLMPQYKRSLMPRQKRTLMPRYKKRSLMPRYKRSLMPRFKRITGRNGYATTQSLVTTGRRRKVKS
jgi:hypothetical protein